MVLRAPLVHAVDLGPRGGATARVYLLLPVAVMEIGLKTAPMFSVSNGLPRLQMRQHAQMLRYRRQVDLILERDDVIGEAAALFDRLLQKTVCAVALGHLEHGPVESKQHAVLVEVDCLGRNRVASDERTYNQTERVLRCNRVIKALVDAASRRPAL